MVRIYTVKVICQLLFTSLTYVQLTRQFYSLLVAASRTGAVSSATPVFGFRSTKPKISMYKIDLRDTIMYEGYEQNHSTLFKKIDLEI